MSLSLLAKWAASRAAEAQSSRGRRRWEQMCLLALVTAAALIQLSPTGVRFLQFDRTAINAGAWWRLVTGNFVHYDWLHSMANLGAFAVLCWVGVRRSPGTLSVVAASAFAVGLGLYVWSDAVDTYRGVSGVDCALLTWILVIMMVQDGGWKAVVWLSILLLMAAKCVFEAVTGSVLLPTSAPDDVEVIGITHIVGLVVGTAVACLVTIPARKVSCANP